MPGLGWELDEHDPLPRIHEQEIDLPTAHVLAEGLVTASKTTGSLRFRGRDGHWLLPWTLNLVLLDQHTTCSSFPTSLEWLTTRRVSYVAVLHCPGMMTNMAGRAPLNRPQAGNQTTYDVGSGRPYRTGVTFQPQEADKIVTAANRMGYSVSGLINELTKRMIVDNQGLPLWYEAPGEQQQSLIA